MNAPPVPWLKHWRTCDSTPPQRVRRARYSEALARHFAQVAYDIELAERGPDHHATRAALGRLRFHIGRVPQKDSMEIEAIAWRREAGAGGVGGHWNRSARKAFDRRMRELPNMNLAGKGTPS